MSKEPKGAMSSPYSDIGEQFGKQWRTDGPAKYRNLPQSERVKRLEEDRLAEEKIAFDAAVEQEVLNRLNSAAEKLESMAAPEAEEADDTMEYKLLDEQEPEIHEKSANDYLPELRKFSPEEMATHVATYTKMDDVTVVSASENEIIVNINGADVKILPA